MKRKYFGFQLIILSTLAFVACRKECNEKNDIYYNILNDEKEVLKYTGNETIKYLHNKSDTVIFNGLGKSTYFNVSNSYDQCPVDIYHREGWLFSYIDNKDSNKIFVDQFIKETRSDVNFSFKNHRFGYSHGITEIMYFSTDTINGIKKVYTNVSKPLSLSNYSDTLYYDKIAGIIRVVTKNDIWELIE